MTRKNIDVEILDEYFADSVNWYITKDELISKVDELFEEIPLNYRDTAKIKLENCSQGIDATIIYTRPETDEEMIIRDIQEKTAIERLEIEEKWLLERLRAKYK